MTRMAAGDLARRWAVHFISAVLVLLAGLAIAWKTGQLDPRLWSAPAAVMVAVVGLWRGGREALWVGTGAALVIILFCWIAGARPPVPGATFILGGVMAAAACGGIWLRLATYRRPARLAAGAAAWALAALLVWRGGPAPIEAMRARPQLAVITALPLFWNNGARQDAPIISLLQTRFIVRALDDPAMLADSGARHLLLAQPRALSPDRLVAIDAWVRSGGRALILADPILHWASDMPIGDRRAAPAVSLLDPLLDHWGVRVTAVQEGEARLFVGGQLMTLAGFGKAMATCGSSRDGMARCKVGKGEVIVVADADLIDDRLWLGDPARPLDPHNWTADTPALIGQWLGASMPDQRRWMRTRESVIGGVRWALLAGIVWAMLSAGRHMFRRRYQVDVR